MVIAAMLAMAGPASAAAIGGDLTIEFLDASQFQSAAALQTQEGDAVAVAASTAGDFASAADADASASISQSLIIDQMQFNAGF